MALDIETEDVKKIHAEVNQLVNQRYTVTNIAVTVSVVVLAIFVPKGTAGAPTPEWAFVYSGSIILLAFLFALFVFSHMLKGMLRLFTTYLRERNWSYWEADWAQYRHHYPYSGYTRPQTAVFMALGLLVAGIPLLPAASASIALSVDPLLAVLGTTLLIYELALYFMGFRDRWEFEAKAADRWRLLLKAKPAP